MNGSEIQVSPFQTNMLSIPNLSSALVFLCGSVHKQHQSLDYGYMGKPLALFVLQSWFGAQTQTIISNLVVPANCGLPQ